MDELQVIKKKWGDKYTLHPPLQCGRYFNKGTSDLDKWQGKLGNSNEFVAVPPILNSSVGFLLLNNVEGKENFWKEVHIRKNLTFRNIH